MNANETYSYTNGVDTKEPQYCVLCNGHEAALKGGDLVSGLAPRVTINPLGILYPSNKTIDNTFHVLTTQATSTPREPGLALLRFALLRFALLRFALLHFASLCFALLHFAPLYFAWLRFALLHFAFAWLRFAFALLCFALLGRDVLLKLL